LPPAESLHTLRVMRPFIESFDHCPRCGSNRIERAAKRVTCGGCGYHFYVNPTCAVAVLVELATGEFLWIRRAKDPGKGMLAMPGGFIDAGEEAESAARREVEEEIGLQLEALAYITSGCNLYHYNGFTYDVLDLFYHARTSPTAKWERDPAEVSAIEILSREAIRMESIAFPSMQLAWQRFLNSRA